MNWAMFLRATTTTSISLQYMDEAASQDSSSGSKMVTKFQWKFQKAVSFYKQANRSAESQVSLKTQWHCF